MARSLRRVGRQECDRAPAACGVLRHGGSAHRHWLRHTACAWGALVSGQSRVITPGGARSRASPEHHPQSAYRPLSFRLRSAKSHRHHRALPSHSVTAPPPRLTWASCAPASRLLSPQLRVARLTASVRPHPPPRPPRLTCASCAPASRPLSSQLRSANCTAMGARSTVVTCPAPPLRSPRKSSANPPPHDAMSRKRGCTSQRVNRRPPDFLTAN